MVTVDLGALIAGVAGAFLLIGFLAGLVMAPRGDCPESPNEPLWKSTTKTTTRKDDE